MQIKLEIIADTARELDAAVFELARLRSADQSEVPQEAPKAEFVEEEKPKRRGRPKKAEKPVDEEAKAEPDEDINDADDADTDDQSDGDGDDKYAGKDSDAMRSIIRELGGQVMRTSAGLDGFKAVMMDVADASKVGEIPEDKLVAVALQLEKVLEKAE